MVDAISHITVGVADLTPVRALWIDQFGLEIVAERSGRPTSPKNRTPAIMARRSID